MRRFLLVLLAILLLATGCGPPNQPIVSSPSPSPSADPRDLTILTVAEHSFLNPLIEEFNRRGGTRVRIWIATSVEIQDKLRSGQVGYDAVWPGQTLWLTLGDTHNLVRKSTTVMKSPIVVAVKESVARQQGWLNKPPTSQELAAAARAQQIRLGIPSPSQSTSGATHYLADWVTCAGIRSDAPIEMEHLNNPVFQRCMSDLYKVVNRSADTSDTLVKLFLAQPQALDALVIEEALAIKINRELPAGVERLHVFYPAGATAVADAPLALVNGAKTQTYDGLVKFLTSPEVRKQIESQGWRDGIVGLEFYSDPKPAIFDSGWGIADNPLAVGVTIPQQTVLNEALRLYQTALRKGSAIVVLLDFSTSMNDAGKIGQLRSAMRFLIDPGLAARYFLQPSADDVLVIMPFTDTSDKHEVWTINGNDQTEMERVRKAIDAKQANGGTDLFTPIPQAYRKLREIGGDRFRSVILFTDGRHTPSIGRGKTWDEIVQRDIDTNHFSAPIFTIGFGSGSDIDIPQLSGIASKTGGTFTHATSGEELAAAFRRARGNN